MSFIKKDSNKSCNCGGCACGSHSGCGVVKKLMCTLVGILLVYGIFYLGTLVRNNIKEFDYIGKADRTERMITVNGYGKVTGSNDIAVTTLGYSNMNKDVKAAQTENKGVMEKIMADLKTMGVEEKDLKSDYSIYPEYNYTDKGQEFRGYRVNSNVQVKIRDLSKIEEVLGLAGKYGANQVNGLTFTIDDPENLKAQARDKAIADAGAKAAKLSKELGVKIVSVVSFNEYQGENSYYPVTAYKSMNAAYGMGGAVNDVANVQAGSQDVVMNVNVTYEIAQ